jgi:AraC-like DNA-binding protein
MISFHDRPSDSPYIERVWRSHSENGGLFHSIAACHWEMVVVRLEGKTSLIIRGPETKATTAECPPNGEWFAIRFKLGTFMPAWRPPVVSDRHDIILPAATTRSFWLDGSAWEYPRFDSAEIFVDRLVRKRLVSFDPVVTAALRGESRNVTTRTIERRFQQVTGLTRGAIRQIERARRAAHLLRRGAPLLDVAFDVGYYDQAHLTRSLKRFVGQSPAKIAGAREQLSFLYNTEAASPVTV